MTLPGSSWMSRASDGELVRRGGLRRRDGADARAPRAGALRRARVARSPRRWARPGSAPRATAGTAPAPADARRRGAGRRAPCRGRASRQCRTGERELGADRERRLDQQVERVRHHALGGVLDRHDAEVRAAALDVAEDVADGRRRHVLRRRAEVPARRQVRVRRLRARGTRCAAAARGRGTPR